MNSSSTPTRITSPPSVATVVDGTSARTTPTHETTTPAPPVDDKIDHPHPQRQKPILMCFICKLSFGNAKLFSSHASTEHKLNLSETEKSLLFRECSSAIIQKNSEEITQISFLEPLDAINRSMSMSGSEPTIDANDTSSDNNNNSNNENDVTDTTMMAVDDGEKSVDDDQMQHPRLTPKSLASLQNPITSAASVIQRLAGDLKFLNSQVSEKRDSRWPP